MRQSWDRPSPVTDTSGLRIASGIGVCNPLRCFDCVSLGLVDELDAFFAQQGCPMRF